MTTYQDKDMGELFEWCEDCVGTGRVPRRWWFGSVLCPRCKGTGREPR